MKEAAEECRDLTVHPIVEIGRKTRFQKGNKAGVGHGRPKKEMSELYDALSRKGLEELWRIVSDPGHPLHRRYAFEALTTLVKVTTPKRIAQTGVTTQRTEETVPDIGTLLYGDSIASPGGDVRR